MSTKTIRLQRHLPLPLDEAFALVMDIERYPEFVPGYTRACIVESQADRLFVYQEISLAGIPVGFHSTATFVRPQWLRIGSTEPPFRHLDSEWRFVANPPGCTADFTMHYALRQGLPLPGFAWFLGRMAETTVAAFVKRAKSIAPGTTNR